MWDEKITARMEQVTRDQIVAVRDDPRLIGYYSDNEMGWWNAALFKMTLEHAPTSGQRQRLIKLLRETYGDDWNKLLADFEPVDVASWEELDRGGRLYLRAGGNGVRVMRQFMSLLADRYYQLAARSSASTTRVRSCSVIGTSRFIIRKWRERRRSTWMSFRRT